MTAHGDVRFRSGATCGERIEKTQGFQALGMLEQVMESLEDVEPEYIPAPEETLEKLREAREMIGAPEPAVRRVPADTGNRGMKTGKTAPAAPAADRRPRPHAPGGPR